MLHTSYRFGWLWRFCEKSPQESASSAWAVLSTHCWTLAGFLLLMLTSVRLSTGAPPESATSRSQAPDKTIVVPANRNWVPTGVDVRAGEAISVVSRGRIVARRTSRWGRRTEMEVGPEGTYDVNDETAELTFPLPSGSHGPAPCFSLVGRIGDGPVFYVGRQKSWKAERAGTLILGINGLAVHQNTGAFSVTISKPSILHPVSFESVITSTTAAAGRPEPGNSVVIFYVDGLRPDVVMEMASMGHLPTIKRLFVDGGVWLSNAFTAFPSDTITSNGTMWTGCFSDRHGLKGQVRFSRRRLVSESYLDPLGPNRSARLLAPQGADKLLQTAQTKTRQFVQGVEKSRRWQDQRTTNIPPLYAYLRANGSDWATSTLPIMTDVPPLLWTRSMSRETPLLHAQDSWRYMDNANATYALRHLLPRHRPVTVIWLPETDSSSHTECRGQFGLTRRTIAKADALIGRVVDELRAEGRLDETYFMLVSDHGHHGGRTAHLSHYDLADEFFFRPREIAADGHWIGGGLGLSVRQHRVWNRHPKDNRRDFVFIDGHSDGAARIFLPKGHYHSGDWSGPNRPGDLLRYPISRHLAPVNLIASLIQTEAFTGNGQRQRPIDLVLLKLSENAILISTADRGDAVIDRKRDASGSWTYRYTPVTDLFPTDTGTIGYRVVENPTVDPLGLLELFPTDGLKQYYDERVWLDSTARSNYPDSVVTLARNLLWQENLKAREPEFAPDLVVTARNDWYFGTEQSPGTAHGYPLSDSMRATWFIAGPNVQKGARIDRPCRLVDLTPTILDMVGIPTDQYDLDGTPLRNVYASDGEVVTVSLRPTFWDDFDLQAWQSIDYQPVADSVYRPWTVNRPTNRFDLHSIAYNILSLGQVSLFRLADDVLFPLSREERHPISSLVDRTDEHIRRISPEWLAEVFHALDVPEVTVSDYSLTSLGNLQRVDGIIDWTQQRGQTVDRRLAGVVGRDHLPGTQSMNAGVDTAQNGFWEVYRFAERIIIQVLDETVLSGIENGTDRAINTFRSSPAEVLATDPGNGGPVRR